MNRIQWKGFQIYEDDLQRKKEFLRRHIAEDVPNLRSIRLWQFTRQQINDIFCVFASYQRNKDYSSSSTSDRAYASQCDRIGINSQLAYCFRTLVISLSFYFLAARSVQSIHKVSNSSLSTHSCCNRHCLDTTYGACHTSSKMAIHVLTWRTIEYIL